MVQQANLYASLAIFLPALLLVMEPDTQALWNMSEFGKGQGQISWQGATHWLQATNLKLASAIAPIAIIRAVGHQSWYNNIGMCYVEQDLGDFPDQAAKVA